MPWTKTDCYIWPINVFGYNRADLKFCWCVFCTSFCCCFTIFAYALRTTTYKNRLTHFQFVYVTLRFDSNIERIHKRQQVKSYQLTTNNEIIQIMIMSMWDYIAMCTLNWPHISTNESHILNFAMWPMFTVHIYFVFIFHSRYFRWMKSFRDRRSHYDVMKCYMCRMPSVSIVITHVSSTYRLSLVLNNWNSPKDERERKSIAFEIDLNANDKWIIFFSAVILWRKKCMERFFILI